MAVGTAFLPRGALRPVAISASFVTFIPPFFAPYLLLWANVRLQEQYSQDPQSLAWWLCALSVAAPAGAFAASQAALITLRNLRLPFVLTIRAVGASEARVRVRLLHHLLVESAPTFEKIAIGMVTALLFAEATFSQSGFGAMILRAIRRTDVDLIIVATTLLAATTALLRLFTMELRASYGLVSR
jgi:ABC-type dipeptide/oligopeptide/nickel transport system permease component